MPSNVADLVRDAARDRPGHEALRRGGRSLTWRGLDERVTATAAWLADRGLAGGDRVALLLGDGIEFAVAYFAVLRAGLVAVPLNTALTPHELRERLGDVGAALVLADGVTSPAAAEALDHGDRLALVPAAPAAPAAPTAGSGLRAADRDDDAEALAVLLFTAGTGGRPKPAMLSHRALLANLEQLLALDPSAMTPDDVVLLASPLFHAYALNAGLGLVARTAATAVLADGLSPHDTLELVREAGVTNVPGTPALYTAWSTERDLRDRLGGVRLLMSAAAALPPAVLEQFRTLTGHPVWEGYGMTEAAPVVTCVLGRADAAPGSVGAPLPGTAISLRDAEGHEVDDGDPGEVWVRGPSLFDGYWPDGHGGPDADGWFATGDVGYVDDDGDLHLVDRAREVVVVAGFPVYPREVERAVESHPDVAECAVIGVPHPVTGEAVKAVVVPVAGADLSSDAVLQHCAGRLARFKCPTIVVLADELPRTSTGKVAKGRLRDGDRGDDRLDPDAPAAAVRA